MGGWDKIKRIFGGRPRALPARLSSAEPPVPLESGTDAFFALTLSELKIAPRDLLPGWQSTRPAWPSWDSERAIKLAYKGSVYAYACVAKAAHALSSMEWQAKFRGSHEPDSPLQYLIDRPNPYWSRQDLIYRLVTELLVTGNSVIAKVRGTPDGLPLNLFTLRPQRIAPVPSGDIHVAGFTVAGADGRRSFIGAHDAIHVQLPDPETPYWGMSPAEAAARSLDTDRKAADWRRNALDNLLLPPGFFRVRAPSGGGGGHMTAEKFKEQQSLLAEKYASALNARRPMLLGGDIEWQQLSMSPADMDFLDGSRLTREEICAVYHTPPPIVGILDRATYSNIETAREIWWDDWLEPLSSLIQGALNAQLAREFGDGWSIEPDDAMSPAKMIVAQRKQKIAQGYHAMGIPLRTLNRRFRLGFEDDELGPAADIGWMPGSMTPVTPEGPLDGADQPSAPGEGESPPELAGWAPEFDLRFDEGKATRRLRPWLDGED